MLAIGRALLNDNRVLLVDEPTKGLSPMLVTEVARVLERLAELTTVLLVEQNLGVVRRVAETPSCSTRAASSTRATRRSCSRRPRARPRSCSSVGAGMSTFVLLTITGLGLGAMYFLIASGLSLIYGLMGVLNFAHGAFITVGGYGTWYTETKLVDGIARRCRRFLPAPLFGLVVGASSPRSSSSS